MGNTPSGSSLSLESYPSRSFKKHLGQYASFSVSEVTSKTNEFGERVEEQSVLYQIHHRFCRLTLTKTTPSANNNSRSNKIIISITEMVWFTFKIELQIAQDTGHVIVTSGHVRELNTIAKFIAVGYKTTNLDVITRNKTSTTTPDGSIIETSIIHYENFALDGEMGIVVIEWKKKGKDQSPYMVTVAHYFVSTGILGMGLKPIGLSMMAKIRGNTGVEFEGPTQHPRNALLQMIERVRRSGCWTPTACPHCANSNQIQRQSHSDGEEDSNRASPTPINRGLLLNDGVLIGDGNGCLRVSAEKVEFYRGGKHIVKY